MSIKLPGRWDRAKLEVKLTSIFGSSSPITFERQVPGAGEHWIHRSKRAGGKQIVVNVYEAKGTAMVQGNPGILVRRPACLLVHFARMCSLPIP